MLKKLAVAALAAAAVYGFWYAVICMGIAIAIWRGMT